MDEPVDAERTGPAIVARRVLIAGCAVGVYQAGEIVLARGYGMANLEHGVPFTPATVFDIASRSTEDCLLTGGVPWT